VGSAAADDAADMMLAQFFKLNQQTRTKHTQQTTTTNHQPPSANLRNVAIPGTGVPLSWFCACRATAALFLLGPYPLACLAAAWYQAAHQGGSPGAWYAQLLLAPQHWAASWRLNCVLVAYHAAVTRSPSYRLEDKVWIVT
jgi:hypothetical protein